MIRKNSMLARALHCILPAIANFLSPRFHRLTIDIIIICKHKNCKWL